MTDKKFHETAEFRKLQREWYDKLEDGGFYDIEGGVEGHLLKGPTSTITLRSLANKFTADHGLKHDRAPREFDDVADDADETLNFAEGGKARYYHHAALLATQAFREGVLSAVVCYVWALHSQGVGERGIESLLDGVCQEPAPRSRIRKHLAWLRDEIQIRLDNEYR